MSNDSSGDSTGEKAKIDAFEGMRGVLALLVCIGHLGLNTAISPIGLHINFELAVDVFFALSGFVLARSYYFGKRSFGRLIAGRLARLWPLHFVTLIWCGGIMIYGREAINFSLFMQNLLLVHNVGLPPNRWDFNFPSWSISVEMLVSLLAFPVLFLRSMRLGVLLFLVGLVLSAGLTASYMNPAMNYFSVFNSGVLRGVAAFCIGSAAYVFSRESPEFSRRARRLFPLAAVGFVVMFFLKVPTAALGIVFSFSTVTVLLALASDFRPIVLASPVLVMLGQMSYSVYLLHIPMLLTAQLVFSEEATRGAASKGILLIAILCLSACCHRYFELPAQQSLLRRMQRVR